MIPETVDLRLAPVADEAARAHVFTRMAAEGRARIVQYHLPEPSLDAWLAHTAPDRAWFCVAHAGEALAAAAWFTDFTGRTAFAHFVIFRGYERMSRRICHLACQWAFSGGMACLLGVIPAVNRAAIASMRASGWREIFRIPQLCFVHRLNRHVDGVFCHFTPNLLCEAMQ
jgi:hypothetical protein